MLRCHSAAARPFSRCIVPSVRGPAPPKGDSAPAIITRKLQDNRLNKHLFSFYIFLGACKVFVVLFCLHEADRTATKCIHTQHTHTSVTIIQVLHLYYTTITIIQVLQFQYTTITTIIIITITNIHMCVCMYVCVYIYIYVSLSLCVYIYIYI